MYRKVILIILILISSQIAIGQEMPGVTDLNIDSEYAEAVSTTDSLPDALDDDVLQDETATQLFSYMKWLFSDNSAQELVGVTLAPILLNLYILLGLAFTFTALWLTIRFLVWTWRLILFVVKWIIRFLELIPFAQ